MDNHTRNKLGTNLFWLCVFFIFLPSCHRHIPWFGRYTMHVPPVCRQRPIVVLVPSYNNRRWCRYNLDSIIRQNYKNFRVIYIDDASPDGTGSYVQTYIKKYHVTNITLIRNSSRHGALYNLWHGIQLCQPHELIVNLDGDDWFANDHVLAYINCQYNTDKIWLTYGQFINWPTGEPGWCAEIPSHVMRTRTFRAHGFCFAQPRTYYAWLAQRINKHDLVDPKTHTFYRVAGDVAIMFPMIEMAAPRIRFIPDFLCIRNVKTPHNDFKCHQAEQERTTGHIRKKTSYKPIYKQPQLP